MRKANLVFFVLVTIYLLNVPLAPGQSEKTAKAEATTSERHIAAGMPFQAPRDDCEETFDESNDFHLVYPGIKASYVGGTVPDMHLHKQSALWQLGSLTGYRQFRRDGQIALTENCLLFAFKATSKDSFNLNENFRIRPCSNDVDLSDDKHSGGATCADVGNQSIRSYLILIPYAKVNLLSRAKNATSDLAAVSTVYVAFGGSVLTAIYSSISHTAAKERAVGIAGAALALYYYYFIAKPRLEDNYIGVFVERAVPQIVVSRESSRVMATTALPHYFHVGQQIEISGVENSNLVDIADISRDAKGMVTVITKNAHRLVVGAQVQIADVADPSFNGQFQVSSVGAANDLTFNYEQKDKPKAAKSAGGSVQDVWNGTFDVESIDSRSFTYWQPGPNENPTRKRGTATVVVPTNTNLAVSGNLALDKTAEANPKSIDLTGTAAIAPPPGKPDELFRKGDVLMFRIPNNHDYYNISMILSGGTGLTFVSEAAEKPSK